MGKESMKKKKEILEQNVCRVINIDKKALFEFVYENFVRDQEDLLDIHSVEHMNNLTIDWKVLKEGLHAERCGVLSLCKNV